MKIYGIIGNPVEHSISPEMHNAAFRELGIDAIYCKFRVLKNELENAVNGIKALGINGFNVTIPYKESIIPYLDYLDKNAKMIGAVNTVKLEGNKLKGYNTDGKGAIIPLKRVMRINGKKALILGAGGAARSISFELLHENIECIYIANRTMKRAIRLSNDLRKYGCNSYVIKLDDNTLRKVIDDVNFVINCTSVGMYPNINESLLSSDMLHSKLIVEDIVYNPLKTRLLQNAEIAGARTISGIEMLVFQGALSFEIWTGIKAPVDIMRISALDAIMKFNKRR